MIKYNTPQELFTAICDKIRDKTNSNELINHQDIPDKIDNLVDSDIINEYNELLSIIINQDTIIQLNNNEIENINISFNDCTNLTTIDLPKCTSINRYTFNNCTNLTTVSLPECTSIGYGAFYSCTNLTTVSFPKCTSIGGYAFNNCASLTTIDLPECIVIDSGPHYTVGTIHCLNLTTINLPKCISIKNNVFCKCTSLTTINLPKCTSIGEYAFYECTSLTTVNLPECTSIGSYAFVNCNLQIIILGADQIVGINSFTFKYEPSINNGTGYIYVPDNLVDSYKSDTNWSTYANQIKPLSELPSELKEEYNL